MIRRKYRIIVILGLMLPFLAFAQRKKKEDYAFLSMSNIVMDGNLQEWQGKLYNEDSEMWSSGVALRGDSIYVAAIVKDPALQREALMGGIVLNISYNSKKRDGARLYFPVADREGLRALRQDEDRMDEDYRQEVLNTTRGYYVLGFDKVVDGLLSFENSYGVRAVVQIDSASLSYEAVIPLDLVGLKSDQFAVKIGVNTQFSRTKANSRNQSRTMGPYGIAAPRAVPKNPYREPTEIWIMGERK